MIDKSAIERISGIGGPVLVGKMIDLLLANAPQRLQTARDAMAAGDLKGVEQAVHSLKSSAGNLGAVSLQELAERVESMAEDDQAAGLEPLLEELSSVWEQVRAALETERKGLEL